ncbi:hypothetical protein BUALT_Bualt03G0199600 [Buddleja alternifolia]|uniref:PGG domain-containing protein n=1 Tax=Buddleja alternifolia TaxID=168488 RepID=A0AAV6Y238_9LAMI|nr:hypothetical protein BUALT_Bualt03G0199600 [Buddleja alternifolia]
MCLSRDCQGRNPLHLAAMRGHVEILNTVIQESRSAARAKADRDQTVLHLCVKHGQLEAFKILAPSLKGRIDAKDVDGDTALDMAVEDKQIEIIRYLVGSTEIDLNVRNSNGQTAIDILEEVLIATVAFQARVSPAGGIWQENSRQYSHARAGEAVMAYTHPVAYKHLMRSNAIAFVSSITTILLLMIDLPFRRRLYMWILIIIMWLTVTSLTVSYAISVFVVTPRIVEKSMPSVLKIGLGLCFAEMGILLIGSIVKWLEEKRTTEQRLRLRSIAA